jgi:hypothetical protein
MISDIKTLLEESSGRAAPVTRIGHWKDSRYDIIGEMYEKYKSQGFQFPLYLADTLSCRALMLDFLKYNFELIQPTLQTDNPHDPLFIKELGGCGDLDFGDIGALRTTTKGNVSYRFDNYSIYSLEFDERNDQKELAVIGTNKIYNNAPDKKYVESEAFHLNPEDNCSHDRYIANSAKRCYSTWDYADDPGLGYFHFPFKQSIRSRTNKGRFYGVIDAYQITGDMSLFGAASYKNKDYVFKISRRGNEEKHYLAVVYYGIRKSCGVSVTDIGYIWR